jgi:hypothetical protein
MSLRTITANQIGRAMKTVSLKDRKKAARIIRAVSKNVHKNVMADVLGVPRPYLSMAANMTLREVDYMCPPHVIKKILEWDEKVRNEKSTEEISHAPSLS